MSRRLSLITLVCAFAGIARADAPTVRVFPPHDGALTAWVNAGPGKFEAADFELVIDDSTTVRARRARPFDQESGAKLWLVVLVESTRQLLSSYDMPTDAGVRGGFDAFQQVNSAISTLAKSGPIASATSVAVIPFAPTASIAVVSNADALPTSPLGDPIQYKNVDQSSLDDGFNKAFQHLRDAPRDARRVVVIIGTGGSRLSPEIRKRWRFDDLEIHAIEVTGPANYALYEKDTSRMQYAHLRSIGAAPWPVRGGDTLVATADAVKTHLEAMHVVEFALPAEVANGASHELVVVVRGKSSEATTLSLGGRQRSDAKATASEGRSIGFWILVLGLVVVGIVVLGYGLWALHRHLQRRSPPPILATNHYIPPQPTKVLPRKTEVIPEANRPEKTKVMRPAGLAAWFVHIVDGVPIRTLVLDLEGVTRIGRGVDADIKFSGDEHMSEDQADVRCVDRTFILENLSKTNPTKLRKRGATKADAVDRVELEDGAILEVGTTKLLFKCVKP